MSYDLHLFQPRPGVDPLVTAEEGSGEYHDRRDLLKEDRNRRIAAALLQINPRLEISEADPTWLAEINGVPLQEAEEYFRDTEINDDETGIQIQLFVDEAGVSVPFWHTGEQACVVFHEIWQYLQVIMRETGFMTYDRQLGRLIESETDLREAIKVNEGMVARVRELGKQSGRTSDGVDL